MIQDLLTFLDESPTAYLATEHLKQKLIEAGYQKLDDEKIVSRSKLLLIQNLGLSEEEAHKFIEKKAMNSGRTRVDIAFEIVRTYENKS